MSQEPQLEQRAARDYAGIGATVSMGGISGAIDEAFPELFGWLAASGISPAGPPFVRFLVIDMEADLRIEMGVPVAEPITVPAGDNGRVRPGLLPGGQYVVLRHIGPYDGLIASNAALQEWAAARGVTFDAGDTPDGSAWRGRFEQYITDPSAEPDPAKWQTDIAYLTSNG
jgi:effector-binding domain-containing protein